jgi:RNA-directed DNA polymerase
MSCKMETLREAYQMAKQNDGAPGSDGVTFEAIEENGVESFLTQIRDELVSHTYQPMRARKKEIPKDGGKKVRVLSIPCIRDRVVQGALKLILEPIFEADFQPGSYGYRPKRTAHQAVNRVAQAIVESKTRIIDIDLRAYFDNIQHSLKGRERFSKADFHISSRQGSRAGSRCSAQQNLRSNPPRPRSEAKPNRLWHR